MSQRAWWRSSLFLQPLNDGRARLVRQPQVKSVLPVIGALIIFHFPGILMPSRARASTREDRSSIARQAVAFAAVNRSQNTVTTLESGQTHERNISAVERHVYQVSLQASQCLHVVLEQKGIDLNLRISNPDKKTADIDNSYGLWGPEIFSMSAPQSGVYLLEVRSVEKGVPTGRYALRIEVPGAPGELDQARVAATQAMMEGKRLRGAGKESLPLALQKYAEALRLWREVGDRERQATTLLALGRVHRLRTDLSAAKEVYEEAAGLWKDLGNSYGEAQTVYERARTYDTLGDRDLAISTYKQALAKFELLAALTEQSSIYNYLGNAYNRASDYQNAMPMYQKSLDLAEQAGDLLRQGQALNGIGYLLDIKGERPLAVEKYQRALSIARELEDSGRMAIALNNLGVLYGNVGDWQNALDSYQQSLALAQTGSKENRVKFLNNIGMLHALLGNTDRAVEFYEQAKKLHPEITDNNSQAATFSGLGYALAKGEQWQEAIQNYEKALELLQGKNADLPWKAYTFTNLGVAYTATGNLQKAFGSFRQARDIWAEPKITDSQGRAYTLEKLADASLIADDFETARRNYNEAFKVWDSTGDPRGKASALLGLARVERQSNNFGDALKDIDAGLKLVESLRAKSYDEELRMSYLASKQEFYEFAVSLRMQLHEKDPTAGYDVEALRINESARARSLIDTLHAAKVEVRQGVGPALLTQERTLQHQLDVKRDLQQQLAKLGKKAEADSIAKEIETLSAAHFDIATRIRVQNPGYADLTEPSTLTLKQIQEEVLTDNDTLLLEYALGEEQSYLFVVSKTGKVETFRLPPHREIETKALALKCLITKEEPRNQNRQRRGCSDKDGSDYWSRATELSNIILGPAAAVLGNKRLLIVPDGELQYLQFGALPLPVSSSPNGFRFAGSPPPLFVKHEIINLPSASALAMLRRAIAGRKAAAKTIAVLADPVFEPEDSRLLQKRVTAPGAQRDQSAGTNSTNRSLPTTRDSNDESEPALARLQSSADEARSIMGLVPARKRLVFTGLEANWAAATSPQLSQYRIIHFATHAILDDQHAERSGIALSRFDQQGQPNANSFLRLRDIYNLKLPADLVVLSACNTALGKRIRGEGLIGLTRGFMYAGSARVVASLWQTEDASTAELMNLFYRNMLQKHMTASAALRAAQIEMWKQSPTRSPYYWAAFVLQGEWR